MNAFQFELHKVLSKRFSIILLIITAIVFPIVVKVIAHLNVVEDQVPEGLFAENVAFGIIAYTQTYFFLPVWIIIFSGLELSNGHVNRVIFIKSRRFYFLSKVAYCGIITAFFSMVGLVALILALETSSYTYLGIGFEFYLRFFIQLTVANTAFSLLLLCLVFLVRSPFVAFVIYFGWTFVEGIVYSLLKSLYDLEPWWLPLHIIRLFYSRNGEVVLESYYNPLSEDFPLLTAPVIFIVASLFITYKLFLRSDLKPLSD